MKMGAMCYTSAGSSGHAVYICPTCNHKTLYASPKKSRGTEQEYETWNIIAFDLTAARRLINEIQKYAPAVSLRENDFCDNCAPRRGVPYLSIAIRYDDGSEIMTNKISTSDLLMLKAFFSGELTYKDIDGVDTVPLLEKMPCLKFLLGEPANLVPAEKK